MPRNKRYNGWIASEVIAGMTIIAMILIGLSIAMSAYNKLKKIDRKVADRILKIINGGKAIEY